MANISTRATVDLNINGTQVQQQLDALTKRADELRKKMDQCVMRGDTKGAQRFQRQLENVERQAGRIRGRLVDVSQTLNNLDKASLNNLNKALRALQNNIRGIEQGTDAWNAHAERIRELRARIQELNQEMEPDEGIWDKINGYWEKFQLGITAATAAIVGMIAAGRSAVTAFAAMEQEEANVRKFTGMTAEEVARLNEEFKKMDTRTDREDLNKLAQEAGRLGKTSVEDVLGFVKAADKINVALDDLGEGATLTLSKLTGIFGDEARLGTEKSLLSVGSVINELSQNCSASAPYLAEFASRMGGVGAQAGMTVQQIMGFAAVLDSNEQKLEASATALSQVVVRIYQDPAKYARVAGMDVQRFAKLVKTDMNQALIEFLSTLKNAGGMDVLSPMFKDMGENGSRAISAMSTLANNIDAVKSQQQVANQAFREATSITKEFDVQNNTVQAGLEKAQYRVHELAVELGEKLQPIMRLAISSTTLTLKAMSAIVNFISRYKVEVIVLTLSIGAYTLAINLAAVKTKLMALYMNANTVATRAWGSALAFCSKVVGPFRIVIAAATNSVMYFTNGLRVNYEMQQRWAKALTSFKRGGWIGVVVAVTAAIVLLSKKLVENYNAAIEARRKQEALAKSLVDVSSKSAEYAEKEIFVLKKLYEQATDTAEAQDKRTSAAQRLIKMYPDILSGFSKEEIAAGKAKDAYDRLTESIMKNAEARAAADLLYENKKKILQLQAERKQFSDQRQDASARRDKIRARNRAVNARASDSAESLTGALAMQAGGSQALYQQESTRQVDKEVVEATKKMNEKAREINTYATAVNYIWNQYKDNSQFVDHLVSVESESSEAPSASYGGGAGTLSGSGKGSKADPFAAENEWRDRMEANAKISYYTGLTDYVEYTGRMDDIAVEFYKKQLQHTELGETERLKIEAQLAEARHKRAENSRANSIEEENAFYNAMLAELKQMYIDSHIEKKEYDQAVEEQEILHQQQLVRFTRQGSRERIEAEMKLREIANRDKLKKQEQFEKLLSQYSSQYRLKSLREQMTEELKILDNMLKEGLIKPAEHERMAEAIRKKSTSGLMPKSAVPEISDDAAKADDLAKLKESYDAELMTEEEYLKAKDRIEKYYFDKAVQRARQSGNEFSSMVIDVYTAFNDLFNGDDENSGMPGKIKKIAAVAEATFAVVNACMQSYMDYSKVCTDLEVARIEKRYDAEAALAEGNVYKQKQAERKKQKEVAKAKTEASKKNYKMQVIQAVAQTAIAALNAYSSAASVHGIGYLLAPIAAAMAVAAGTMQIATIKKQQQLSEAQGYMEGGFTPSGRRDEAVGVVHAGEWVAPQSLVRDPETRPIINMLERARLNRRPPAITFADVSATTPAGAAARVRAVVPSQVSTAATPDVPRGKTGESDLSDTIRRLNERLNEPFVTVNTVTGDFGTKQAEDEYKRLMKNKSR